MDDWNDVQRRLQRIEKFASWMDDRVAVPGTRIRFGLDSVIGFLPGVGDLATGMAGMWLLVEAVRLGTPKRSVAKMLVNLLVDVTLGAVPLVGDLFDVYWKSNRRNAELIQRHIAKSRKSKSLKSSE